MRLRFDLSLISAFYTYHIVEKQDDTNGSFRCQKCQKSLFFDFLAYISISFCYIFVNFASIT